MREVIIGPNEGGQRFDKYLKKYMKEAGNGFLYKMLRKKNITLNGRKADGSEKIQAGDRVCFFLAEDTIDRFRGAGSFTFPESSASPKSAVLSENAGPGTAPSGRKENSLFSSLSIPVLYEDAQVLLADKPAGLLTQKAQAGDYSLNEWLTDYLLTEGKLTAEELATFRPSVCNRLDRNTSGLVVCGKTLAGSQKMSELIRNRSLRKYYRLFVAGRPPKEGIAESWLLREENSNQVRIYEKKPQDSRAVPVRTGWRLLESFGDCSFLEVELFTGKTHQIRAQMAALGFPLIGDARYGNEAVNRKFRRAGVHSQLLHAFRLEFPPLDGPFLGLSERSVVAPEPETFARVRRFCENGQE
ncbi:MAG TPA: RluA family pseudouridine synthase [Candidatus Eisenbergiella merdavium]|uniref:RNA pseudouridylate synthase n=1 Tax=Candidatus Eisenbergiella merdavium TaxID=2838551 RepID=A0A9D2SQW6_9FIRM|nr:RluA family pseudouridine synthase [Candidatus Eisenbergiella merdavium]